MSTTATGAVTEQETGALEVRDTRTGTTYELPILPPGTEGDVAMRGMDLRQIKVKPDEFGLMSYDPAFMNTASCKSAITYIDGDAGILRYRGYPIEQLAEGASFLETAWLLRNGELPTRAEYDRWVHDITYHTYVHENIRKFLEGFRYDAHPMSMLCSTVAAHVVVLSRRRRTSSIRSSPQHPDHPAAGQAADAGRVRLPAHQGAAVRLPGQRAWATSRTSSRCCSG